jgi:uncharacterized protein (DUF2267 family)
MQNRATQLAHAAQQAQEWMSDLASRPPFESEEQAYSYLRAVLHALRDRLSTDEAVHLASQLPTTVRGFYYEGWKPSRLPVTVSTQHAFIELVQASLNGALAASELDPTAGTQTVFEFLADHVDSEELEHVKAHLSKELNALFSTGVAG